MKVLGLINDRIKYYEHCEESSEDINDHKFAEGAIEALGDLEIRLSEQNSVNEIEAETFLEHLGGLKNEATFIDGFRFCSNKSIPQPEQKLMTIKSFVESDLQDMQNEGFSLKDAFDSILKVIDGVED